MVAMTLLAIFGTSLFLTQTNLFQRLLKTHTAIINLFETDQQLLKFHQQIQQALQQKKPVDSVTFHHENKNPSYVTDIKIKHFSNDSKLFKDFEKTVGLVQATIQQDNKSEDWWSFIYIAKPKEDENIKKTPQQKTQGVAS
ncbi:hypothetical protein KBB68_04190 [Candidatus Babeliales bacterium]|nr:hypothetical protein [Candidatus Babeliales bacterium]